MTRKAAEGLNYYCLLYVIQSATSWAVLRTGYQMHVCNGCIVVWSRRVEMTKAKSHPHILASNN